MYLKTIEVQGFKSFAEKIRFEFHNGITGIVGPNGSGKSNVADAVRWVFGEQSAKQLRSSNMQDVIFAGTQIRKPQSFAEVSIMLSNEDRELNLDFDEVTVTRKVYRMGESEYRLNGNPCRLKDIYELFYDTGIGKEGYSIIGQGQVDKILSAKPEERRELFDEACGIVKFKKRKQAAEKKLDSERQNMVRVTDILSELEKRVGPLKKQSETAKEYLKLRDELKSYDINAFLIDSKALEASLVKLRAALEDTRANLAVAENNSDKLRREYADVEAEINSLDAKIEDIRDKIAAYEAEKAGFLSDKKLFEEKIRSEKAGIVRNEERLAALQEERENLKKRAAEAEAEEAGLQATFEETDEKIREVEEKIRAKSDEVALYEANREASSGEVIGLLHQKSVVTADLKGLETILEQNAIRLAEYKEKHTALKERIDDRTGLQAGEKASCEGLIADLEKETKELEEAETEFQKAENEYRETETLIAELKQEITIDRGRLESLKAIRERYEGFQPAVRAIMDEKKRRGGIHGTVSDLISVKKAHRTLIETALGGNFQNIIVEDEATAKALVELLKTTKGGRATFLPLDAIRSSGGITNKEILSEPGVIGTADSLVSADPKYLPAVKYLLDRFLAVDNVDNALKIARKYRYTVRIVTLDGEFLNVGGSIAGGSFKSNATVLGRQEELKELEERIEQNRKSLETLERNLNRLRQNRETLRLDVDDLSESVSAKNLSLAEHKAQYDAYTRELAVLAAEKTENEERMKELESESREAELRRKSISEAKDKLEKANTESSDSADTAKTLMKQAEEELSALQKDAESIRLARAHAEQRELFLTETLSVIKRDLTRLDDEEEDLREEIELFGETITSYETEIADLDAKLAAGEGGDTGLKETFELLDGERDKLARTQKAYFDKRDQLYEEVSSLTKEVYRLESSTEKAEEKLEALTEYLYTEYELYPSEAEAFKSGQFEEMKPAEIRRHANELKAKIKALGPVNVNAIDEYKEVAERYEFLNGQYQDLKAAEDSLVGIIKDLDDGMRKQFLEEFEKIRQEFDVVFRDLFGGGTGKILLEEGKDVTSADIQIISEPPGKKLRNMLQLSGGERALTAIALIFAIQNLKPSPFCLLDEIEAALDDTNVVRFTNYLKKLSDRTQYIVITHRRGTMVAADRLYGITMQEKGVSALVSVNLVEKDLDA